MSNNISQETVMFKAIGSEIDAATVLATVCQSLKEKGYNPINQLIGYLTTGDPAYITSHNDARTLIRRLERDKIIEELVQNYLKDK